MPAKIATIYAVRVDFKNGLHLEYHFAEPRLGAAKEAYETVRVAREKAVVCEVFDDAGRSGVLDGKEVQAVQLVDLVMETRGALAIAEAVDDVRKESGLSSMMDQQRPGAQAHGPTNGAGQIGATPSPVFAE